MTLYVLIGEVGSGKTHLAKMLEAQGYTYFNFDKEWYTNYANKYVVSKESIRDFIHKLVPRILQHENAVIDGWMRWSKDFYLEKEDFSLIELEAGIGHQHDVRVLFSLMRRERLSEEFKKKFDARGVVEYGGITPTFLHNSLYARHKYLWNSIMRWFVWDK